MIVVAMEISELFNFEKIAKEIGIHSPVFIYGWLFYNLRNSRFFLIMLILSILLSVLFIVCGDYIVGRLEIKKFGTYKSDEKRIVRGISNQPILMSIMALFAYLQLANLAFSVFLIIGYLIYKSFDIITFILTLIGASGLVYRIILFVFNIKGTRQLSANVNKELIARKLNQSKPPVSLKRKRKSR
ncbi:TPA: hypothetical protein HA281_04350 [Candidatus Woesearchaeota archaeon]|nr:hypothetical protein [Candidatus Woesearchaeota archaeon]HII64642.1 hypothetical protein [Candidatus Woesearchaeota archaeon]HIJ18165.1 hypothetical protein [Candidatus Woesearchaeota archaeon]